MFGTFVFFHYFCGVKKQNDVFDLNETFLKTFMRMIDQTFKQDGGIGTYLDKSLDKGFIPYSASSYINLRFFFDLLFFLLILLLIFQMFLSTIIDYFNDCLLECFFSR